MPSGCAKLTCSPRAGLRASALILALLAPAGASADGLACADPVAAVIASRQQYAPAGVVFETRAGISAQAILARFNAASSDPDIEADQVTIGVSPDLPRAVIIFGLRGCAVASYWINAAAARSLLGEGA